jgi:hypothetical protein
MELPHLKHGSHGHNDANYWASWCSPVGLGIFFITTALAAAVAIYAILSIVSGIMALSHPAPSYSYPATYPSDSMTGSGVDASGSVAQ